VVVVAAASHHLFTIDIPVWEKALRTAAIYGGIVLLLRLAGKRDLAQLNSLDLVVLLLLSNVVQNAIIGDDLSLEGGLLGAGLLIAFNAVVVRLVQRSTWAMKLIEGSPSTLVKDGKLDERSVARLGLRAYDVMIAIHRQGASSLEEVKKATLAPGGGIEVELWPSAMDATKGDLDVVVQKLDRLLDLIERRQPG
jgi:uncharacterized membrane protein YcaP (DUF421 family)